MLLLVALFTYNVKIGDRYLLLYFFSLQSCSDDSTVHGRKFMEVSGPLILTVRTTKSVADNPKTMLLTFDLNFTVHMIFFRNF